MEQNKYHTIRSEHSEFKSYSTGTCTVAMFYTNKNALVVHVPCSCLNSCYCQCSCPCSCPRLCPLSLAMYFSLSIVHARVYFRRHTNVCVPVHVHLHVYFHLNVHVKVCTCACSYTFSAHVHVFVYVHTHTHVHVQTV